MKMKAANKFNIRRYQAKDREDVITLHRLALQAVGTYEKSGKRDDGLNHIEEVYLKNGEF